MAKVLVIGDSGCGKSCLIHRYKYGRYPTTLPTTTVGVDYITIRNVHNTITGRIYDAGGGDAHQYIIPHYFSGVNAVMIVFDGRHPHAVRDSVYTWWDLLIRYMNNVQKIPVYIVCHMGNQTCPPPVIEPLLSTTNVHYRYVDASSGLHVDKLFTDALTHVDGETSKNTRTIVLRETPHTHVYCCY